MAVKKPVTKTSAKVVATKPTVTVETKKISSGETCCSPSASCCKLNFAKLFTILLIVVNTILLSLILINQTRMEVLRAGWRENYGLLRQVYQTEGYKGQQKQQLEQALQILSQPQQATTPSAGTVQPAAEQVNPQQ